ncbi:GNAT family protein [Lactobacillus sp. ESL0681]|uniref:GNAT family N-acetyltransferase n=1 Tax=Lactobacillus sp. ESL0681 TaxID=2983211 RepID=UPI0023F91E75|nr:GNAT family protein [Lactobacillus sp. ESL0681]WEV39567.1 GNAT family protein [Lactobacillus sp. ESL0681]
MFKLTEFMVNDLAIQLVLPEVNQAEAIYQQVADSRASLARFLPWAKSMSSVEDEAKFIKMTRTKTANYEMLELVITVAGQPAGMLDLHQVDWTNESAEIGYWLGESYRGKGIMTESVRQLVVIAFNELGLHRLNLLADHKNTTSRAVAQRLNFTHVALLRDELKHDNQFHDMDLYTIINEIKND